jgi:DNA polymerase-1
MSAAIVGFAVSFSGYARYVPIPLPDGTANERVYDAMRRMLGSDVLKVGHNLKPALVTLGRIGIEVDGPIFDTMVAHYLCAPEQPHSIEAVVRGLLGLRVPSTRDLLGSGRTKREVADVAASDIGAVACGQAHAAVAMMELLRKQLAADHLDEVADRIELPLIRVLATVERTGVRVDTGILAEISGEMRVQIDELERNIYVAAGCEFNIGSPAQLAEILFERLGLPVLSKTSTGKASTKELVLSELAAQHELPALILDWRELSKLKNTYVDALPALVNPETGRIHTSYNQTVAATGRLSSQNPNLQNIPVRTARGREIRKAFVPEPGWLLLAADYVQIELRILASMSADPGLRAAFERGLDIHTATAARMFGIEPDEVNRTQRNRAKEVNYGIPYGMSAFGLAQRLRCSRAEAQELIDGYRQSYRQVAGFLARQVELVREKGYAETLLGRRRYIPDINARNSVQRAAAERIAFNMPMQGTQADMIKLAMIAIQARLDSEGLTARMLLQVHDELVFETPPDEVDGLSSIVRSEMTGALPLEVPVEVEISVAGNWLDAH